MKALKTILMLLPFMMTQNVHADDIFGQGNQFIKITEAGKNKDYIKFELCLTKQPHICSPIGKRLYYSKKELVSLRNSEKKDIALAALADVGLIIVAVYGGAFAGAIAANSAAVAPMVGASAGATAGSVGAGAMMVYVDAVNPVEQYRQVDVLKEDIIQDRDVIIKRDIEDIAHTLRTVLSNLD